MNSEKCLIIDMHEKGVDGAVGRVLGIQLKDEVIQEFKSNTYAKIILDFSKVEFITSGFAKELFGGLYNEYADSLMRMVTVRIGKENEPLKNTIIRALATVFDNRQ